MNRTQGYDAVSAESNRRLNNRLGLEENPRGRPQIIGPEKKREIKPLLKDEGFDASTMTWGQLGSEVQVEADGRTVRRAMHSAGIYTCIACRKELVDAKTAEKRVERARMMLEKYPDWQDWKKVRFSDEVHFGWSDEGRVWIKRPLGERNCPEHIHHPREPRDKDRKRFHCWAAVGWNFKSDIYFYNVPTNTNGKMTQAVYIDQILEKAVKPWLEAGHDFVLEEDGDSGHGPGPKNPVQAWKEKHGLKHYFNVSGSPRLSWLS